MFVVKDDVVRQSTKAEFEQSIFVADRGINTAKNVLNQSGLESKSMTYIHLNIVIPVRHSKSPPWKQLKPEIDRFFNQNLRKLKQNL